MAKNRDADLDLLAAWIADTPPPAAVATALLRLLPGLAHRRAPAVELEPYHRRYYEED